MSKTLVEPTDSCSEAQKCYHSSGCHNDAIILKLHLLKWK